MSGPTRQRKQTGDLHGPASTSRQVRAITVHIEQLPEGRWRFTMPKAPGWAAAAATPGDVTASLRRAFTEAQVSAYSDWRGHLYDQPDAAQHRRHRPAARSRRRCDVYEATAWRLASDGRWISPSGHRYTERTQCVRRVMAQRSAMGLPLRPDPVSPDYMQPRVQVVSRKDWSGSLTAIRPGQMVRLARPSQERSSA